MAFPTNSETRRGADALAFDPYSPITPTPDGTESAADPMALDPYSPIVGHAHRADWHGGEVEGE